MADDPQLSIALMVDISALQVGLKEAEAAVKIATRNMAEAQAAFGTAAAQGSTQAQQVLAQYAAELDEAKARVVSLSGAIDASTSVTKRNTTATEESTTARRENVSGINTANIGLRTFSRSVYGADRGAATFLATTLGLGPVLQKAFPVVGAVALISVLVDLGEQFYNLYENATHAGQAIANDFAVANDKARETADSIELTNSRLQDEIDKLEHHPGNGLRTALLEAKDAADKLQASIDADNESLDALLKKHDVSLFGALTGGTVRTGGVDKDLEAQSQGIAEQSRVITRQYDEAIVAAKGDHAKLEAADREHFAAIEALYTKAASDLQPKLQHYYDLQRQVDQAKAQRQTVLIPGAVPERPMSVDYSPIISDYEGTIEGYKDKAAIVAAEMAQEPLEQRKGKDIQAKEAASEAKQAEEQHLHDLENAFAQEELLYGKSANQTAAYWSQYLNDTRLGADQLREVYEKVVAARAELGKKQPEGGVDRALKRQVAEAKKDAKEYQEALDEMAKARTELFKSLEQEPMEAQAKQGHAVALNSIEEAHTQAQIPYQSGAEQDPTKQLAEVRAYHEAVLSENERFVLEQVAQLEAANPQQVDAMEKLQQDLTDAEKTGNEHRIELAQEALNQEITAMTQVGGEQAKQLEELQNKLTEIEHDGNMKRLQDTEQKLQQQLQKYKQVYDLMTNDFNHAFEQWATKEQTAAQAFSKMLMSMETGIEQLVLQELEKKLFPALMKLLHIDDGSNSASQANQQALTTDRTVNPQIVESNSAAAASLVFLTSGGDVAAAAETYAEGMMYFPLAAFEHGGIVSGINNMPVPIVAHAGERVLTQFQNRNLETLANQSQAGRGNTNHLHYNPTIHALDKNNFERAFRNQKDTLFDMMRGWRP